MKLTFTKRALTVRETINYVMKGICGRSAAANVLEAEGLALSGRRSYCFLTEKTTYIEPTLLSVQQSLVIANARTNRWSGDLAISRPEDAVAYCILAHTFSQVTCQPCTLSVAPEMLDHLQLMELPTPDSLADIGEFLDGLSTEKHDATLDSAAKLLEKTGISVNLKPTDPVDCSHKLLPVIGEYGNSSFSRNCLRCFADCMTEDTESRFHLAKHPRRASIHAILVSENSSRLPKTPGKLCALIASNPLQIRNTGVLDCIADGGALLLHSATTRQGVSLFTRTETQYLINRKLSVFVANADYPHETKAFVTAVMAHIHGAADSAEDRAVNKLDLLNIKQFSAPELPTMPNHSHGDSSIEKTQMRFHLLGQEAILGAYNDVFETSINPLALDQLFEKQFELNHYPLVLQQGKAPQPLYTVYDQILDDMKKSSDIFKTHKDYFIYKTALALRECSSTDLISVLKAGLKGFLADLELSETGRTAFNSEIDAFFSAVPEAECLGFDSRLLLKLYHNAVRQAKTASLQAFMEEARKLHGSLKDILAMQDIKEQESHGVDVGPLLGSLFKENIRSPKASSGHGTVELDETRRKRIEFSVKCIGQFLEQNAQGPRIVLIQKEELTECYAGVTCVQHEMPLGIAKGVFKAIADDMKDLFLSMRIAKLESKEAFDEELHTEMLSHFSLDSCTESEWAVFPTVTVVANGEHVQNSALNAFSALVGSKLPIHVLLTGDPWSCLAHGLSTSKLIQRDLSYLAISHQNAFVSRSALSSPEHLYGCLENLSRSSGPGVFIVSAADASELPYSWAHLHALQAGRFAAQFQYNPELGTTWAERFDFSGSLLPEKDWIHLSVPYLKANGTEASMETDFTFADAVTLLPSYRSHFMVIESDQWGEHQIPLTEFIQDEEKMFGRYVPFIWVKDTEGEIKRAIITRTLLTQCVDHLNLWRTLRELGGIENSHALAALEQARLEAETTVKDKLESAAKEHRSELESVRTETAKEALSQLARVLVEMDPGQQLGLASQAKTEQAAAPKPSAKQPQVEQPPVEQAPVKAAEKKAKKAPEPEPVEEEEAFEEEAWVDTELCTSCNECVSLNPLLFLYNDDKQVYLGDPEAGTFLQLVSAAEKCPSRCIHPGSPRSGDSTVTDELVAKAAKYN
ncbi:MAG: hypothetical protein CSA81_03770 [Acidobacteria bacterium]|nr:MAG: hypothetical protein CSA81_03770 [Acidobacteriota bacterium]